MIRRFGAVLMLMVSAGCGYHLVGTSNFLPDDLRVLYSNRFENRTRWADVEPATRRGHRSRVGAAETVRARQLSRRRSVGFRGHDQQYRDGPGHSGSRWQGFRVPDDPHGERSSGRRPGRGPRGAVGGQGLFEAHFVRCRPIGSQLLRSPDPGDGGGLSRAGKRPRHRRTRRILVVAWPHAEPIASRCSLQP